MPPTASLSALRQSITPQSAPLCEHVWDAGAFYVGRRYSQCFEQSERSAQIISLRRAALACTRRHHQSAGTYSEALFGIYDNPGTAEYDPKCAAIFFDKGTYLMRMAEPANSLSSFRAYDEVVCTPGVDEFHESAAYMGWASFNYHASGGPQGGWTLNLDQHSISCIALRTIEKGLRVTRTPLDLQVAGLTFNASELAYRCAADGKRLVEMCNDDRDEVFLDNMNAFADAMFDSVPYAYDIIPVVYAPYMRMCLGELGFTFLSRLLILTSGEDVLDPELLSLRFSELPELSRSDYTSEGGVCREAMVSSAFLSVALVFYGYFGDFGRITELHNVWHYLSGKAFSSALKATLALERKMSARTS